MLLKTKQVHDVEYILCSSFPKLPLFDTRSSLFNKFPRAETVMTHHLTLEV